MIHTKLYLYNRNAQDYKGTDYSKYVLQGDQKTDDLTDVLDVVNLTLAGLTRAEEFEPTTKFIYEKWYDVYDEQGNATQVLWKSWDIMVAEDLVEKPILSDDNYYNHQITFNEASVVAQGRIVDNIATTYRLKDVSLDTIVQVDSEKESLITKNDFENSFVSNNWQKAFWNKVEYGRNFKWKFPDWFTGSDAQWNSQESDWADIPYYVGVNTDPQNSNEGITSLTIPIPMLEIQKCIKGTNSYQHEGYCTIRVIVSRYNILSQKTEILKKDNGNLVFVDQDTITEADYLLINPLDESVNATEGQWNFETYPFKISAPKGEICNKIEYYALVFSFFTIGDAYFKNVVNHYDTQIDTLLRKIVLSGDNLKPNMQYSVNVILYGKPHDDTIPTTESSEDFAVNIKVGGVGTYNCNSYAENKLFWSNNSGIEANSSYVSANLQFVTYDAVNNKEIFTAQAPPQSAYELFVKAQLCSQNYEKVDGTPITDLSNLPFYVSKEDEQLLKNTQVVENFYNQKNFWEILLDIGKYIHSIPRIVFGENDRFLVTFDKLGRTEQFEDSAMPLTIINSKSIENYISACSSYVSNMVQLGGVIDEWVAPKSSSEDYLVYNDVAEIITSKPIIEIVSMEIKCTNPLTYGISSGNETQSMTTGNGYVFEENVYQLIGINTNEALNKSLAIFYKLGSTKIEGLNYQLPVVSTGDVEGDYAIKKIIRKLYGLVPSTEIYINDFIFHIVYRTKDTVRTDQTRPDLRKYMLNTQLDKVPQHNQFNNQQDILVDSVKFGNNIYGKLIRTGNSEFTITEWVQDVGQLKQIGQLYKIRDNIYYVAKVDNTYFVDHITSVVTYSKDYNQLSEIIGIPSEPRFYEISEQSLIGREVSINDYLVLSSEEPSGNEKSYVNSKGFDYIKNLLFDTEDEFPKYAITTFKNDKDYAYGQVAGNELYYKEVCNPVNTYSVQNTLTMEWDMIDNFSAGEQSIKQTKGSDVDKAYYTLTPYRYPDVYGRVDLIDFAIFKQLPMEDEQIYLLPQAPYSTTIVDDDINEVVKDTTLSSDIPQPTDEALNNLVNSYVSRQPMLHDTLYVALILQENQNDNLKLINFYVCTYINNGWQRKLLIENGTVYNDDYTNIAIVVDHQPENVSAYDYIQPIKPIRYAFDKLLFSNETEATMGDNAHGIALMKDNRETISINYNLQMLTDSDRFVLSSYLWQPNKSNLKVMCLNEEISKITNDTIPSNIIIQDKTRNLVVNSRVISGKPCLEIPIHSILSGVSMDGVKAIVIASENDFQNVMYSGQKYFVLGKNITGIEGSIAEETWYITGLDKNFFEKKQ